MDQTIKYPRVVWEDDYVRVVQFDPRSQNHKLHLGFETVSKDLMGERCYQRSGTTILENTTYAQGDELTDQLLVRLMKLYIQNYDGDVIAINRRQFTDMLDELDRFLKEGVGYTAAAEDEKKALDLHVMHESLEGWVKHYRERLKK